MAKRLNQEEFVAKAVSIHGSKYDYSKVRYIGSKKKICIICPKHGEFWQKPVEHLQNKGCPICALEQRKCLIYGVGINDGMVSSQSLAYARWATIIKRCYANDGDKCSAYKECSICDEWILFTNFEGWFNRHYIEGFDIDKDILVKGNKIYSPSTCCFVPKEINMLFVKANKSRGVYPVGVSMWQGKFRARMGAKTIGYFNSAEDAFNAYKRAKEAHIKEVADKWKDQLEPRAYEALYNYKVEIND